jgi:ribonuclease E
MTRKRVGQGLLETFSTVCESCNGRGRHVHLDPVEPAKTPEPETDRGSGRGGRRGTPATPTEPAADRPAEPAAELSAEPDADVPNGQVTDLVPEPVADLV